MATVLVSAILAGVAAFSLLMALFEPWLFPPAPRLDAVRASVLSRERYERLVVAERPWWERLLAPLAARLGTTMPGLASGVGERAIIRAGFDPATLLPAEVVAAKLVLGAGALAVGLALTPLFDLALLMALPAAFLGYVFPSEYLAARGRRRTAQLRRELPDFLALVRPLSESPGLEKAMAAVADELHAAAEGDNLLAHQIRGAIASYGTGVNFFAALGDVAVATDLEELDELTASLGQARRAGKGVPDVLADHERNLREAERNRLLGAASAVQPKLAAILAAVYLPMFIVLIVVPLFLSTVGRI